MLEAMEELKLSVGTEVWESLTAAESAPALASMPVNCPDFRRGSRAELHDQTRRVAAWICGTRPDPEIRNSAAAALAGTGT